MKQTVAIFILIVLFVGPSHGQVGFGLTGGVNFATVGGADVPSGLNTLTGFVAGAYLEFPHISQPLLSLQPEILYTMKGYIPINQSFSANGSTFTAKVTASLNYLEIPILIKYKLSTSEVKPPLFVGPTLGILLIGKMKSEATGSATEETDIKSKTRDTDWGIVLGASANVAIVRVNARYTLGESTLEYGDMTKVYNRVLSLMLELPM